MQIRLKKIIVIFNLKTEQIWKGSVFVAINSRLDSIDMDDNDSPNVYKCDSSKPNHQQFNVLNTWNVYLHSCSTDFGKCTDDIQDPYAVKEGEFTAGEERFRRLFPAGEEI